MPDTAARHRRPRRRSALRAELGRLERETAQARSQLRAVRSESAATVAGLQAHLAALQHRLDSRPVAPADTATMPGATDPSGQIALLMSQVTDLRRRLDAATGLSDHLARALADRVGQVDGRDDDRTVVLGSVADPWPPVIPRRPSMR